MKEKLRELYSKKEISSDGLLKAVAEKWITTEDAVDIVGEEEALTIIRAAKLAEISQACNKTILDGIDVILSDGTTEHFSLQETDQINLTTAYNAVQTGAAGYPYHADGQLCKMYSAEDITTIGNAATSHKLYHLTYCNHLMTWARGAETAEEIQSIYYGAELPDALATNMEAVLNASAS